MPITADDYKKRLEAIVLDSRYRENLDWGVSRPGHPEGSVRAHIAELEKNLELLTPWLSETDVWRLKLLIHTHDLFKRVSQPDVPISHPRSHASLAREFLAEFSDDQDLLMMVQYHDEPYALYRKFHSKGTYNQGRMLALLANIADWNLFLAFQIIDGCTEGKGRESLNWFFDEVLGRVESRITKADIR
jgi:hypothetical protein